MSVRQNLLLFFCTSSVLVILILISLEEGTDQAVQGHVLDATTKEVDPSKAQAPSDESARVRSPVDVATHLRELHLAGSYSEIEPWIVVEERERIVTLLRAVDEVIAANNELQFAAQKQYHTPATDGWNLAAMKNNLGPFSSEIRIINQRFVGDVAYVTLQEGDNVPLMQARFEWNDGRWEYRPRRTPSSMIPELHRLAKTMRDIAGSVQQGAPFDAYMDAFHYRVLPQMARVVSAQDEPGRVASASAGDKAGAPESAVVDIEATDYAPQ